MKLVPLLFIFTETKARTHSEHIRGCWKPNCTTMPDNTRRETSVTRRVQRKYTKQAVSERFHVPCRRNHARTHTRAHNNEASGYWHFTFERQPCSFGYFSEVGLIESSLKAPSCLIVGLEYLSVGPSVPHTHNLHSCHSMTIITVVYIRTELKLQFTNALLSTKQFVRTTQCQRVSANETTGGIKQLDPRSYIDHIDCLLAAKTYFQLLPIN